MTGKGGARISTPPLFHSKAYTMDKTKIFIRLRAHRYTLAEISRLLGLTIKQALDLDRRHREEVEIEAAIHNLKHDQNKI